MYEGNVARTTRPRRKVNTLAYLLAHGKPLYNINNLSLQNYLLERKDVTFDNCNSPMSDFLNESFYSGSEFEHILMASDSQLSVSEVAPLIDDSQSTLQEADAGNLTAIGQATDPLGREAPEREAAVEAVIEQSIDPEAPANVGGLAGLGSTDEVLRTWVSACGASAEGEAVFNVQGSAYDDGEDVDSAMDTLEAEMQETLVEALRTLILVSERFIPLYALLCV